MYVCVNLHITSKVKLELSLCNILNSCLLFSKNKEITIANSRCCTVKPVCLFTLFMWSAIPGGR